MANGVTTFAPLASPVFTGTPDFSGVSAFTHKADMINGNAVAGGEIGSSGVTTNFRGIIANSSIESTTTGFTGPRVVDQYRITTDYSAGTDVSLNSNWERWDSYGTGDGTNAVVGGSTKVDESTGVFTFDIGGIYGIFSCLSMIPISSGGGTNNAWFYNQVSTNINAGSPTWNTITQCNTYGMNHGNTSKASLYSYFVFDATAATHAVRLKMLASANTHVLGDSNVSKTYIIFTRFGDT
tara:strand:+ start:362 stop:1078 length:717 start_codon:yes stop_codon:yes gene_type:complete